MGRYREGRTFQTLPHPSGALGAHALPPGALCLQTGRIPTLVAWGRPGVCRGSWTVWVLRGGHTSEITGGPTSLESTKAPAAHWPPQQDGTSNDCPSPKHLLRALRGGCGACGVLAPEPQKPETQPRSPGGGHGAREGVRAESSGISSRPEGRGGNNADGTGADVESELPCLRHSCQRGQGLGSLCWKRHPLPEPPAGNPPAASFHPRESGTWMTPRFLAGPQLREILLLRICDSATTLHTGLPVSSAARVTQCPSNHAPGLCGIPFPQTSQQSLSRSPRPLPVTPASVLTHQTHRDASCQLVLLPHEAQVCLKSMGVCRSTKYLPGEGVDGCVSG